MNDEKQRISEGFNEFMKKSSLTQDGFREIVNALSYYIVKTNINYKYNLTYLESYCESFYRIKFAICRKQEKVVEIVNRIGNCLIGEEDVKIFINIDGYWKAEIEYVDNSFKPHIHYGEIIEKLLLSPKAYLEIIRLDKGKESNFFTSIELNNASIEGTLKEVHDYFMNEKE